MTGEDQLKSQKEFVLEDRMFGYLTVDKARRIYPMVAGDPQYGKVPLVGVWVYGLEVNILSQKIYLHFPPLFV